MERNVIKSLSAIYYGILILAIIVATSLYLLITKGVLMPIDPMSVVGKFVQYIVILDMLLTVPGGLYLHKRRCRKISLMENEEGKMRAYQKSASVRIGLVGNDMVLGMAAFYLLGAYTSMLWVAAIAAIGWVFTKPTASKMMLELLPPSEENY